MSETAKYRIVQSVGLSDGEVLLRRSYVVSLDNFRRLPDDTDDAARLQRAIDYAASLTPIPDVVVSTKG